jgi:hypothetical protein
MLIKGDVDRTSISTKSRRETIDRMNNPIIVIDDHPQYSPSDNPSIKETTPMARAKTPGKSMACLWRSDVSLRNIAASISRVKATGIAV